MKIALNKFGKRPILLIKTLNEIYYCLADINDVFKSLAPSDIANIHRSQEKAPRLHLPSQVPTKL